MSTTPIQRIQVWSKALRASHWLMAVCVITLLLSGWVLAQDMTLSSALWRDAHVTTGYLLAAALAVRVALLVAGRAPTDRWRDCLPLNRQHWRGLRDMLIFYVSFARMPLPAYFGHNPLWGPLYLLLFGVLAFAVATGLLLARYDPQSLAFVAATPWWLGWTLPEWHIGLAWTTGGFAAAHVLGVFLHDSKGTASEISAMVNGHKIFLLPRAPQDLAARVTIMSRKTGTNGPN